MTRAKISLDKAQGSFERPCLQLLPRQLTIGSGSEMPKPMLALPPPQVQDNVSEGTGIKTSSRAAAVKATASGKKDQKERKEKRKRDKTEPGSRKKEKKSKELSHESDIDLFADFFGVERGEVAAANPFATSSSSTAVNNTPGLIGVGAAQVLDGTSLEAPAYAPSSGLVSPCSPAEQGGDAHAGIPDAARVEANDQPDEESFVTHIP